MQCLLCNVISCSGVREVFRAISYAYRLPHMHQIIMLVFSLKSRNIVLELHSASSFIFHLVPSSFRIRSLVSHVDVRWRCVDESHRFVLWLRLLAMGALLNDSLLREVCIDRWWVVTSAIAASVEHDWRRQSLISNAAPFYTTTPFLSPFFERNSRLLNANTSPLALHVIYMDESIGPQRYSLSYSVIL